MIESESRKRPELSHDQAAQNQPILFPEKLSPFHRFPRTPADSTRRRNEPGSAVLPEPLADLFFIVKAELVFKFLALIEATLKGAVPGPIIRKLNQ